MPRVALLLSRQSRQPTPQSWWLRAVWALSAHGVAAGWTLVAGDGLLPLDFAAWAWREQGGGTESVPLPRVARRRALVMRDREVAENADMLIAVAVRPGGGMEKLGREMLGRKSVQALAAAGKETAGNTRLLEAGATLLPLAIDIPAAPAVARRVSLDELPRDYLWHCTRSCAGPWPGETREEYFASLADNLPGAAHSADDALDRILAERLIRGRGDMIRGGASVVCWSESPPDELLMLRRFRPALLRWDFEPAAIGVSRAAVEAHGGRPVVYAPAPAFDELSETDRPFFQKHEPPEVDYSHEREWRTPGDFSLAGLEDEIFIYRQAQ